MWGTSQVWRPSFGSVSEINCQLAPPSHDHSIRMFSNSPADVHLISTFSPASSSLLFPGARRRIPSSLKMALLSVTVPSYRMFWMSSYSSRTFDTTAPLPTEVPSSKRRESSFWHRETTGNWKRERMSISDGRQRENSRTSGSNGHAMEEPTGS